MLEDTYVIHLLHLYANTSKINLKIIKIIVDTRKLGPIMRTIKTKQSIVSENGRGVQQEKYLVSVKSTGFD